MKKIIRHYIAYVLMAVTLFYIVFNIYEIWPDIKCFFIERPDKRIILSFFPAMISTVMAAWGVRKLLSSRNKYLSLSRAFLAFYFPQYGKYIPGKVWSLVMAWSLSKRLQLTAMQVIFITLFNTLFGTVVSVVVSTFVLSAFLIRYRAAFLFIGIITVIGWLLFPLYCHMFERLG